MTVVDKLAEQHIREHEARLAHIDELLSKAQAGAEKSSEGDAISKELADIRAERSALQGHISSLKQKSMDEWQVTEIEKAGPLIIWDAVAKKLEKLVERLER